MDEQTSRNFKELNERLDYLEVILFKELLNKEVPTTSEERAKILENV